MTNAYKAAGVDVEAGYEVVERIKNHVRKTERKGVLGHLGSFGGCFDLSSLNLKEPVLVSGTDGVGTKLMLAQTASVHHTIGIDCVAMCVNDILAQGAEPLYFLDYIATGKNDPDVLEQVVAGVAEGCQQAGAALIGGETAEMPGMYAENEYDLAGFVVGAVEKSQLIDGGKITEGHLLYGLPSSGIHSNGYSLVRKTFFSKYNYTLRDSLPGFSCSLQEELLRPTKIYYQAMRPLLEKGLVHGAAHITGGGFIENIPRMLPQGLAAEIQVGSWPVLPIFDQLASHGSIPKSEMFGIFNMGIGMVLAVAPEEQQQVETILATQGEAFYLIGKVRQTIEEPIVFVGEPL